MGKYSGNVSLKSSPGESLLFNWLFGDMFKKFIGFVMSELNVILGRTKSKYCW